MDQKVGVGQVKVAPSVQASANHLLDLDRFASVILHDGSNMEVAQELIHCREEAAETCFYDYQLYISHSTWILRSAAGPIAGDFAEFEYMSGISIT